MSQSAKPTILVAEDDPVFRHLLQFTIENAGYRVIAACDGEAAWRHWQANHIDLLVTDHQMPHCSGMELIDRISEAWPTSDADSPDAEPTVLPILLCTAKGLELTQADFEKRHQILGVFGKPFSPKTLIQRLDTLFATSECESCQCDTQPPAPDEQRSATSRQPKTLPRWSYTTGPVAGPADTTRPAVWSAADSLVNR